MNSSATALAFFSKIRSLDILEEKEATSKGIYVLKSGSHKMNLLKTENAPEVLEHFLLISVKQISVCLTV